MKASTSTPFWQLTICIVKLAVTIAASGATLVEIRDGFAEIAGDSKVALTIWLVDAVWAWQTLAHCDVKIAIGSANAKIGNSLVFVLLLAVAEPS
jgi:hypothetical protein